MRIKKEKTTAAMIFAFALLLITLPISLVWGLPSDVALRLEDDENHVKIDPYPEISDEETSAAFAFWMKVTELSDDYQYAFHFHSESSGTNVGDSAMWGGLCDDNRITITIGAASEGWDAGRTDITPDLDEWYHLAAVWDGSKVRVYVNGKEETNYSLDSLTEANNTLWLGYNPDQGDRHINALLMDVGIWLDKTPVIEEVMNEGIDSDSDGLVGYWPLDEGEGDVARDLSANENHGELREGAGWTLARPFVENLPRTIDAEPGEDIRIGPIELQDPVGEVTFQWYHNGEPVEGATENTLLIEDINADELGMYYVEVNDEHPATPVRTNETELPRWPVWRVDLEVGKTADPGDTVTLGPVELFDARGEVAYQWYLDGEPVEGATESTLTLDDITLDQMGKYFVEVNDELDMTPVTSSEVVVVEPDWPMWRFDAARSANTPLELNDELHLQWVRELPEPRRAWPHQWDDRGKLEFDVSYTPVVKGDKVFVPSNVTDSMTAYDIEDGSEMWRFYADGPVRLAPAVWRDRVFFTSDDGHLYCVSTETGDLIWKFRGGPSNHRLLGNERIINFWAARGGPVVYDDTVYFAAGVFPLHGIFIYALDAESGEMVWVNDTTSSDYVRLPHGGADGFGGLSPQGYIAAEDSRIIVSAGRGQSPVHLNRTSGEVISHSFRGSKGGGNYAVHAMNDGGMGYRTSSMLKDRVESVADQIKGAVYIETDRVGGGFRSRHTRDNPDATHVYYKLAARDRLILTTEDGRLYCFGPQEVEAHEYVYEPGPLESAQGDWDEAAAEIADNIKRPGGYGLVLGKGSGELLRALLHKTDLHLVVVENDEAAVRALRDELAESGMYGSRAAVIAADPSEFTVQPYLFSLVASEDAADAGIAPESASIKPFLELLMPYSGIAWLGTGDKETALELAQAGEEAGVDRVTLHSGEDHVYAERAGPLTGGGEWTHQYHDSANTLTSRDQLARLPLGVLWFGGPNNHNILPRHSGGPRPKVSGGRQVFLGVETTAARCVYTGRELWEREFPGIGHPSTDLGDQRRWEGGRSVYMSNIPGVTYIGSPFVTLQDAIYLRYEGNVHVLNPETGETEGKFALPGRSTQDIYGEDADVDWGHISVQGDYLIATSEPHLFGAEQYSHLGRRNHRGTSSRQLAVLNRHSGELLWKREAKVGFRHKAIVSHGETLYLIDGLSENAIEELARRDKEPEDSSRVIALNLKDGEEQWNTDSEVFGTFLLYSAEHDILVEGGSQDLRRRLGDEPRNITARSGENGKILWEGGRFLLPAAVKGDMLIPGRPGDALSILTGERWMREQPYTGDSSRWRYRRRYGCNTLNASENLLLFRTGYAGFFDLEHDSGTGNFAGFRSGCTANMIAADGVVNALEYTRTCTCSYALQTSLALVHMPDDPNIEFWTRYDAAPPSPAGHGINFGAPGRRVHESGVIWYDRSGTHRHHPSAISGGNGIAWVAASGKEIAGEIEINDILDTTYNVTLHFAELKNDVDTNDRVFDVFINGEKVLSEFDIVVDAGDVRKSVAKEFELEVTDGKITIELQQSENSVLKPLICGIEIDADMNNK